MSDEDTDGVAVQQKTASQPASRRAPIAMSIHPIIVVGTPSATTPDEGPAAVEDAGDVDDGPEITVTEDVPDEPNAAASHGADPEPYDVEEEMEEVSSLRSSPPPPPRAGAKPPPPPAATAAHVTSAVEPVGVEGTAADAGDAATVGPPIDPWWDSLFGEQFLRTTLPPSTAEIARQCDFIESSFGLAKGSTLLDVGSGLGLHAVDLTSRGYVVAGVERSPAMVARATQEAADRACHAHFLHADFRDVVFDGAVDGILCWGTTFGFFDETENLRMLDRFQQTLRPGGRLLLETIHRDFVVSRQPGLVWFEGNGCVVMEETDFEYTRSRLLVKRTVMEESGEQSEQQYSIRLYSVHELTQLLARRGFQVIEVSGWEAARGVFFGAEAPRLIVLAERQRSSALSGRGSRPRVSAPPPVPDQARNPEE